MDSFGNIFKVSIFGESHSPCIGATISGVPAGIPLSICDFTGDIARRSPASVESGATGRRESDIPEITCGIVSGKTDGSPLTIRFRNEDIRPEDYEQFKSIPRPGHADYTSRIKYQEVHSGGGQFSGRMTLPLVAAGVVAKKILGGISVDAELVEIGGCSDNLRWKEMVVSAEKDGDSLGGIVECRISGVPAGLGEPFFDSVESLVSHAVFSIPGIRGIEFGDGFRAAAMKGSEHNDPFGPDGPLKNGSGGINGGITNGAPIVFRVAVKPSSSIRKAQQTWNFAENRMDTLSIVGRHDVCFALRTPVVVEAMAAIVIADLIS